MTYNLKVKETDPRQLEAVIREVDAEVVLLQELNIETAAHFEEVLQAQYPHRRFHEHRRNIGMGVLSRYPITSDEYWLIERSHQRVTLDIEGQQVTMYHSRMLFPVEQGAFANQRAEFEQMLARVRQETGPTIWAGDFNMSDQSDNYRDLSSKMADSYRSAGWGMGFTFPAAAPDLPLPLPYRIRALFAIPVLRLDYIFHNDFFETMHAQVWPRSGQSDHLPVYAVLKLKP